MNKRDQSIRAELWVLKECLLHCFRNVIGFRGVIIDFTGVLSFS